MDGPDRAPPDAEIGAGHAVDRRHVVPVDRRHVVPQPAARGAAGHIRMNPQEDPWEREARASARQSGARQAIEAQDVNPADDPAFMSFMDRWPSGKTDDLDRAHAAWRRLSGEDCKLALDGIDAFRLAVKADGRGVICAAATYLRQRNWERVRGVAHGTEAGAAARQVIRPFSRAWWAVLHRRRGRGENVRSMLSQAACGVGYAVAAPDLPSEAEELALAQVQVGSNAFAAWRDALAEEGLQLPDITAPFVWMPEPWPCADDDTKGWRDVD
jgi:hypothetical protein